MAMPTPSKSRLLKLKEWLTVPETAQYLSVLFGETVGDADVLRFGLDGHLQLSVRFVNTADVWRHRDYSPEERALLHERFQKRLADLNAAKAAGLPKPPPDAKLELPSDSDYPEGNQVFRFDDDEVYDLPLEMGERLYVEQRYQDLVNGPEVTLINIDGACVMTPDGKRWIVLERHEKKNIDRSLPYSHPNNFFPAGEMPEGTTIVVRTAALREFEERLQADRQSGARVDRPFGARERATLLTIISALLKHADIDTKQSSKAAVAIETLTATIGARVAARTIEEHLKLIPDALDRTRDA